MYFFIIIITFVIMEAVVWLIHKYIMHGILWSLHEDHHVSGKGFLKGTTSFF